MLLHEAQRLVHGERNDDYGNPFILYTRIAQAFSAVLGHEVDYRQAILCMEAVKLVREALKTKYDNRIDGAAYWEVLDWAIREEAKSKIKYESQQRIVSKVSEPNGDPVEYEGTNDEPMWGV